MIHLKPRLLSLRHGTQDSRTWREAGYKRGILMVCLYMNSCGGIASVVAGETKVWISRIGHRGAMESSFPGGRHAHTCGGCLHWARTPHIDAFQRSWWAHQIQIHILMLDLDIYLCVCTGFSHVGTQYLCFLLYFFLSYIGECLSSRSNDLTARGPADGVTYIPHPISVSKQLARLLSSPRRVCCLHCNQNSRKNGILHMQKQTMRRK